MPTTAARFTLAFVAATALAVPVFAQSRPANATAAVEQQPFPVPPAPEVDARTLRQQFRQILEKYPPSVARMLKMDPVLMRTPGYVGQYPMIAGFLAAHPEVAHNPGYYLEHVWIQGDEQPQPNDARSQAIRMYGNMFEAIGVFLIFMTVAGLFAWLVRTFIDYRRWLRLSRIQTEVHNKLLERFAGTGDLMTYVQTPAGRRFLESAPIPLDAGPARAMAAPFGRILWSVQAGVVLLAAGLGFQFASGKMIEEVTQGLWLIGVLATALGLGFIVSGGISYVLSQRLGLLEAPPPAGERSDATVS